MRTQWPLPKSKSKVRPKKVPVRYRPNAASGGWSYGRGLVHCRETRFDIISLNIHKTTSRWHLPGCCTLTSTADFCCLARHTTKCSTALPEVFSRDLQVCQFIRTHKLTGSLTLNLPGVHVGCINYGLL